MRAAIFSLVLLIAAAGVSPAQDFGDEAPIAVKAAKANEHIVVDVHMTVNATPEEVWTVLTDYDHMTSFLVGFQESRIVSRDGDRLQVFQKGKESYGIFSFDFDNLRSVELTPFKRIVSHLISGNLRQSDGETQLLERGQATVIVYHGDFVPNVTFPPLLGMAAVESQTRKQFEEIRAEIERRKGKTG
jgi:hypothetical protein